ncbi:MAG: DM13 domain-containing protein [Actinomycetota bacterium]|nr:DM13 domain-containing protein [Actinomycetota bacterium]
MSRVEATEATDTAAPPDPPKSSVKQILTWLGLIALLVSAILGSNMFSLRDRLFGTATPDAALPAASRVAGTPTQDTVPAAPTSLRSSPWWQDLTTLDGTGTMTSASFTVPPGAIQWRVKWTCDTGHLVVRAPKQAKAVVDGACPQGAEGYSVAKGQMAVQVTADGPWHLQISQQVDIPLVEPPLAAMTAGGATTVGTGAFYNIDKTGTGKVTIYHQADGRFSARLEDFFVSPNVDLELRLSALDAPHSSQEVGAAPYEIVATMDVTAGSVNYTFPEGVDPGKYKSVVVWCPPIKSAYAAATLGPAR